MDSTWIGIFDPYSPLRESGMIRFTWIVLVADLVRPGGGREIKGITKINKEVNQIGKFN
ncbi:MAG: hypothetical protein ACTSU2_09005 [Promethearchaeota archaeon]